MKTNPFIITLGIVLCALLTPLQDVQAQTQSESERLNAWFEVKFEEELMMSPLRLTTMGRKDRYNEIDDFSEEAEQDALDWRAASIQEMEETFDYEQLDTQAKMSYDLWVFEYENAKKQLEFTRYDYVFHQMNGIHSALPSQLINFHGVSESSDMSAYIERIEGVGRAINQLIERAKLQAEMGIRPPRFAYEIVMKQSMDLISGMPFTESEEDAPLWSDARSKINGLEESESITPATADQFRMEAKEALQEHFKPAYENLIEWLETDMENTEEKPTGVSRHENGDAYYQARLNLSTTTDYTADDIHQIGLNEVARIQSEMREIKNQVGFEGDLQEFFEFVSTDEQFFYPETDEGRQGYLQDSRDFLQGIEEQLPNYFGILPKAGLVVKRVEAFREQDGAPQHYYPGTPDGKRDGIYYAHLSDMSSMPKPMMEAIAYHEGNPGHHMQISIAQELTSVPTFRTQNFTTVYVEGWALYSETLAKEMGGYENPYSDFGRLVTEIWRAIRLVVDSGLHGKGWTEEQAVQYFLDNSPIAEGAVRAEVRRYMVWAGQATAYKIGMIKIGELRAHAEEQLGDRFDIRDFHDTILGSGSLPLNLLEKHVNNWIAAELATE